MKYISKKQQKEKEFNYGSLLKEVKVKGSDKEENVIRLLRGEKDSIVEDFLVDELSFYISAQLGEFFSHECLHTTSLVEACEKFNQIVQTAKA